MSDLLDVLAEQALGVSAGIRPAASSMFDPTGGPQYLAASATPGAAPVVDTKPAEAAESATYVPLVAPDMRTAGREDLSLGAIFDMARDPLSSESSAQAPPASAPAISAESTKDTKDTKAGKPHRNARFVRFVDRAVRILDRRSSPPPAHLPRRRQSAAPARPTFAAGADRAKSETEPQAQTAPPTPDAATQHTIARAPIEPALVAPAGDTAARQNEPPTEPPLVAPAGQPPAPSPRPAALRATPATPAADPARDHHTAQPATPAAFATPGEPPARPPDIRQPAPATPAEDPARDRHRAQSSTPAAFATPGQPPARPPDIRQPAPATPAEDPARGPHPVQPSTPAAFATPAEPPARPPDIRQPASATSANEQPAPRARPAAPAPPRPTRSAAPATTITPREPGAVATPNAPALEPDSHPQPAAADINLLPPTPQEQADQKPSQQPARVLKPVARPTIEPTMPAEQPTPRPEATAAARPLIQVKIGRIEIRAMPAPGPPAAPRPDSPALSLDNYLKQRDKGKS